ncbi:uncharacterized protein K452DRAFT_235200, partial [Aplosporella prunicola CBS 121167]
IRIDVGQGPKLQSFHAHEAILLAHSGYFRSALKDCIEADMEWDSLPDADPDIFGKALVWFYTGKLPSTNDKQHLYRDLCRVWVLGEMLSAPGLQDHATRELLKLEKLAMPCPPDVLYEAYHDTNRGSPLRKLVLEIFVKRNTGGEALESLTRGFLKEEIMADVATAALKNMKDMKFMGKDTQLKEDDYLVCSSK